MTQTTEETASVIDPVDDIASLLMDDKEEELGQEAADQGEAESQQVEEGESEGEENEQSEEDLTWAKALGVDDSQLVLDEDGNLKGINVKVDGEVSTVAVKDLIAGYQLNKHVTQKSQALAEEKREFDNLKQSASKAYHDKLQTADKLLEYMDQALLQEFNGVNWDTLRTQNPGEYAALQEEYRQRKIMLSNIHSAIETENEELSKKAQEEQQKNYQQYLQTQYQQVLANNPEWNNTERMREDIKALSEFAASTYNISPDEFAMVNDARQIEVIKDAMAYRKGKIASQQKIQKVPSFQKAKGKVSKPMSKVTQLTLNARKASGPKQRELQRDAVAALLLGQT